MKNGKKENDNLKGTSSALFPIVGLGGSAGGIESLKQFFSLMPSKSGMSFVIIQHLPPDTESYMPEIIQHVTQMGVAQAHDGVFVRKNTIYIIPPGTYMSIHNNCLKLSDLPHERGYRHPIDFFFKSLAHECRERAVGIILSGTGTDGTEGLQEIKEKGGVTMVDSNKALQFNAMPQSAITSGAVDYAVPISEMPGKLIDYHNLSIALPAGENSSQAMAHYLQMIYLIVKNHTGNDFSQYNHNTITRRIECRMKILSVKGIKEYVELLSDNQEEVEQLVREFLINVTHFFRDPHVFEQIRKDVFPALFHHSSHSPVRVWVPGCSTGEEAYSFAILLHEYMEQHDAQRAVQIFATDVDVQALQVARSGLYFDTIAESVDSQRLRKYFVCEGTSHRIIKPIREMLIFAQHNVIHDPPFHQLDIISCRNLLIYFQSALQRKTIPLFYNALNPEGFLILGQSENLNQYEKYFKTVDKKSRIFRKKASLQSLLPRDKDLLPQLSRFSAIRPQNSKQEGSRDFADVATEAQHLVFDHYCPSYVVVDDEGGIVSFSAKTDRYLSLPTGLAKFNIFSMVHDDLCTPLRIILNQVMREEKPKAEKSCTVQLDDTKEKVKLIVQTLAHHLSPEPLFVVIFYSLGTEVPESAVPVDGKKRTDREQQLKTELFETREYLRITVEELKNSNKRLKESNEDLMSANEELESTNEELETSQEELQSLNEELVTLNEELHSKIEQLSSANDDISNLLKSVKIPTLFLDTELHIKWFTPEAEKLYNLIKSDIGRLITDITAKFEFTSLKTDVATVVQTATLLEREIITSDDEYYVMRVRPYFSSESSNITGVVLSFMNVTALKKTEQSLRQEKMAIIASEMRYKSLVENLNIGVVMFNADMRIVAYNRKAKEWFSKLQVDYMPLCHVVFDVDGCGVCPECPVSQSFEDKRIHESVQEMKVADESRVFRLISTPIIDNAGELSTCILMLDDQTDQIRAEQAVARIAKFPDENPNPVMRISDCGSIIYANTASSILLQTWRCEESRQVPQNVFDLLSDVLASGEVSTSEVDCGSVIYSLGIVPIFPERYINIYAHDITARIRAKEQLESSEMRYRELYENLNDGFIACDLNGRFMKVNKAFCKMLGYSEEELFARSIHELTPSQWHTLIEEQRALMFESGSSDLYQKELIHKDGRTVNVEVQMYLITNDKNHAIGMWSFIRNIEERIRAQRLLSEHAAELERINAELDNFTYTASHDLRAPARTIKAFAEILQKDFCKELSEEGADLLRRIIQAVKRLNAVIEDLLSLSKLSRIKNPFELTNMKELFQSVQHKISEEACDMTIVFNNYDNLPDIICDKIKIERAINNILSNAVKFSDQKNGDPICIDIGYKNDEKDHIISITDYGIGIDPKYHEKIFGSFERLHTQAEYDGTGAGLYIVRCIMLQHGGSVWVESETGKGSTFFLKIPKNLPTM